MRDSKINLRLSDVMRAAMGLAMVDGGFVIAVQIITFLLNYFGAGFTLQDDTGSFGISKSTFIISIIGMLNLSAIIYRMTGLSRGIKYSPTICYQQALRRWPVLILLYIVGTLLLAILALPLMNIIKMFNVNINYSQFLLVSLLVLIPYGFLACIFVIDQDRNPLQAIAATFDTIKNKISMRLLLNISIMYALPVTLNGVSQLHGLASYVGLFNSVWFLFCHILVVVVYAGAIVAKNTADPQQKSSKVIIV